MVSAIYAHASSLPSVVSLFSGIQTLVVAIVTSATESFGKTSLNEFDGAVIAGIVAAVFGAGATPILVILLAALSGPLLHKSDASPRLNVSTGKVLRCNGAAPDFTIRASRRFFSRRRTLTKNFYASDAVSKLIPISCAEKNSQ